MKRGLVTVLTTLALALTMGVGTASASDLLSPPGGQVNASDQDQIQVIPIAPQVNAQNVNVLTFDDVEQGNANNANTGQASQQENTASGSSGREGDDCRCPDTHRDGEPSTQSGGNSGGSGQANVSEQEQVQIVPIAPQVNLQNVNVATFGDVEQGNANNANTGQANQQSNTASSGNSSGGQSRTGRQGNFSEQEQVQIVPIAPQLNAQNVNILTFDDVEQGNANNANTGQANQQSNTASSSRTSGGQSQTARQGNFSEQEQVQFIPIAPQLNAQNVNILTFDDVEQGNANNANTGQANQQSNTASSRGGHGNRGGSCKCSRNGNAHRSGGNSGPSQVNVSEQEQVQFIPIAPQANFQNVNILTFDDVRQGNANNANTGQANQQSNTASSRGGSRGGCCHPRPAPCGCNHPTNDRPTVHRGGGCKCAHPKPEPCRCGPRPDHPSGGNSGPSQVNVSEQEQVQFIPIAPQLNAQNVNILTFDDVEQGNANNANTGQANQQSNTASSRGGHGNRGGSCKCSRNGNAHRSGGNSGPSQVNVSEQEQVQFIPIAPQANFQNVNILTFDDVRQGNANNANTGQANQQSNTAGSSGFKAHGGQTASREVRSGPTLDAR